MNNRDLDIQREGKGEDTGHIEKAGDRIEYSRLLQNNKTRAHIPTVYETIKKLLTRLFSEGVGISYSIFPNLGAMIRALCFEF